jgi:invasion protein IalB
MIRDRKTAAIAAGVAALVLGGAYVAFTGGGKAAQSRDIGNWHMECGTQQGDTKPTCALSQRWAFDQGEGKDKRQVVGLAAIVHIELATQNSPDKSADKASDKSGDKPKDKPAEKPQTVPVTMLRLITPLGSMLLPGIVLQIDGGKQVKAPYMTCIPGGCMTDLIFDKSMLDQLKAGKSLVVAYQAPDGSNRAATVSLTDFPKALDALEAARQHG